MKYRRLKKYNLHRNSPSPYRRLYDNLYRKLRGKYKPSRGGGSGGGYKPRKPYTLSHHQIRYQPEPQYKPKPQTERQPIIIRKTEPNPYQQRIEYKPDAEDLIKKMDQKFKHRLEDILEQINEPKTLSEYVKEIEKESETNTENKETSEITFDQIEDAKQELENDFSQEDFEKDMILEDEAEALSEILSDEQDEIKPSPDSVEEFEDMPVLPPEESVRPIETTQEINEAVMEDPLLALDLEPEMLTDVEILIQEIENEEIEPDIEPIEYGY